MYFLTFSVYSFFGSQHSMSKILSGHLCAFLGKATNKIFFADPKMTSHLAKRQRASFSTKNRLQKCLNACPLALPNWAFCT